MLKKQSREFLQELCIRNIYYTAPRRIKTPGKTFLSELFWLIKTLCIFQRLIIINITLLILLEILLELSEVSKSGQRNELPRLKAIAFCRSARAGNTLRHVVLKIYVELSIELELTGSISREEWRFIGASINQTTPATPAINNPN